MTLGHTRTVDRRTTRTRHCIVGAVVAGVAAIAMASPATGAGDPLRSQQWALERIGAPQAWGVGRGAGSIIAVIDSGIDLPHEDLTRNVLPGRSFVSPTAQDDHGHGTHVAGTAAGVADNGVGISGVAPDAKLLPVKALTPEGGSAGDVAAGIRHATDAGATVINLSLGPEVPLVFSALDTSFADAIRYAWSKGVICVLAAGNNGLPISDFSDLPAIVVTAVDRDDRKPAYATSVGAARWALAAPGGAGTGADGDDILSTYWFAGKSHQYAQLAGTSMAAPHVSGAAAVLRGLGLPPQETVDRLLATATDLGSPGRDSTYGSGRLALDRAVQGLRPSEPASRAPAAASTATTSAPRPPVAPAATADAPTDAEAGTSVGDASPPPPSRAADDVGGASPLVQQPNDLARRQANPEAGSPPDETPSPLIVATAVAAIAIAGSAVYRRARRDAVG